MARAASRRTVLGAALAAAAAAAAPRASAGGPVRAPAGEPPAVDNRFWSTYTDWRGGRTEGTRVLPSLRPGLVIGTPVGTLARTDPHTGRSEPWEYAVWTSPWHRPAVPATEAVASWNARTPSGTWLRAELRARYGDGTRTPWFTMGCWASGDEDIRRTSVGGQGDGRASVHTDTLAVDDPAAGTRFAALRLRLTLHRRPGGGATPLVWRAGAMASCVPDRSGVPAEEPRLAGELVLPAYSQNVHTGRYPEYDGGGEAWCSPACSQMVVEYWGRRPDAGDLAWVDPAYGDPQVCHAARATYDHGYQGCGNWAFNTAYAASYPGLSAVVTRLGSMADLERLIAAGIPVIASLSFAQEELTGAGYGTAGHLMTVVGFSAAGDVVCHDPAAPDGAGVRRVYRRSQWAPLWLRTRRRGPEGRTLPGPGGVCYLVWPARATHAQRAALAAAGVR
ncbi:MULTISPECIES: C39 family peptidase [Streptomyces]|uniref:C39 family peptidase n=1 Tax=Streptomyces TaxID=1883 RepID=UPI0031EB056A